MASSIATLAIEDYVEIDPVVATAYRLQQGANVGVIKFKMIKLNTTHRYPYPCIPRSR